MFDAVAISDLHLGSNCCLSKDLNSFLKSLEGNTKKLILNGDIFHSLNFKRLKKDHWNVLDNIKKLSEKIEVIWITGNHERDVGILSTLLGTKVEEKYILNSGSKKILFLHGHIFDNFIIDRPVLTWMADSIYWLLQKLDKKQSIARWAKKKSKQYLRCKDKIKKDALVYMEKDGCDLVCCGHSHYAEVDKNYYNSGCWTEVIGTYLTIDNGNINLNCF